MNAVLDASVFVAALSPTERHHAQARRLFERLPESTPYLVPTLFRVEVIAALSRRGESVELLDLVDAMMVGPRFHAVPLDSAVLDVALKVSRAARIRAYDAVYVAVAMQAEAPLCTLDREVRIRVEATFPGVVIWTEPE